METTVGATVDAGLSNCLREKHIAMPGPEALIKPTKPDSRCTWTLIGDRLAQSLSGLSQSCQIQTNPTWRMGDYVELLHTKQIEIRYRKIVWLVGSQEFTMHRSQVSTIIADILYRIYDVNPEACVYFCTLPPRSDHHKDIAAAIICFNWSLQKVVMKLKGYSNPPRMIRLHSIMLNGFLPKPHYFAEDGILPSVYGAHRMVGFILQQIQNPSVD